MSNTSTYINELEIINYKCFRGKYKFSFINENKCWCQWTVFLGNNNTGKTNLLKAIVSANLRESTFHVYNEDNILNQTETITQNPSHDQSVKISFIIGNRPFKTGEKVTLPFSITVYGYGVVRNIENKGISVEPRFDVITITAENLLKNSKLINFEEWLFQLDYAVKNGKEKVAAKRDLLIEVLKSEIFPEINDIRFVSDEKANNHIEYQTKDGWRRLSELGYGYQAMLSWLMDFCKKLFDRYPDSENPLKEPAVLLVDEIDLHLHPYWQRTIIKYLSDLFPQTQFIVTTYSPFILQSMENVNLYTLRREGDHTISTHLGQQSFIGWSIEEILSEIMELGDDIHTDYYQNLSKKFDAALDAENYQEAKKAYDELSKILHPTSVERKLMELQLSQIVTDD
jgi:predicted ATP-binding protein involved in virulence